MNNFTYFSNSLMVTLIAAFITGCSNLYSNSDGMSYYLFDEDVKGSGLSACYGNCAIKWTFVPTSASSGAGFDAIERTDGGRQLTYKGSPIYYFAGDTKPGDRNGDGLGGVWHVLSADLYKKSSKAVEYSSYGNY